jgi:signal transduction histidine kinase
LPSMTVILVVGTIIAYLVLGLIVIVNNTKALINRYMLILSLNTALWALSVLMVSVLSNQQSVLFWIRTSYAAGILIPWHIYALGSTFHRSKIDFNKTSYLLLGGSIVYAVLSFTPLMVSGVKDPLFLKEPVYGLIYYPFFLFYLVAVFLALQQLRNKLAVSKGLQRFQIKYLLIGTVISILLSSLANVILPLVDILYVGSLDLRSLGPAFSLILVGLVTYAIVRYRFMDIRFALRNYFYVFFTALFLAGLAILLVRLLFSRNTTINRGTSEIIVALIVFFFVIALPYLKGWFQFILEKVFFRNVVDYHKLLPKKARALENILELDQLLDLLTKDIVDCMNLEYGFYSKKENDGTYMPTGFIVKTVNVTYNSKLDQAIDPLIGYVVSNKEILLRSDLRRVKNYEEYSWLEELMEEKGIEAIVPLVIDAKVEGILALGAKLSGEPFYQEDIDLLAALASQVSTTLINARLYEEILKIKQYQEKILLNMGNGLVAVNEDEIITTFNNEAEYIFSVSAGDVIGEKLLPTLGEEIHKLYDDTIQKQAGINQVEIKIVIDNKVRYLSCHTSIVEASESTVQEVIIVLGNITRLKELEQERGKSQRLASLGEVAAGIAHEIKNPLVSIKTFADLLPEKYADHDFRNMFSNVVSQEINRINELVGELLNFVKEPVLLREPVKLPKLINEVIALLTPQLDTQGIIVKLNYQDQQPSIFVDKALIKQTLLNICVNAIHAMSDGGTLVIGTDLATEQLTVYIDDTGCGIPEAIKDKIFDPFVTSKADGIGIGLSICHKVVAAHGGRITAFSNEGKGSRFEIILPLQ